MVEMVPWRVDCRGVELFGGGQKHILGLFCRCRVPDANIYNSYVRTLLYADRALRGSYTSTGSKTRPEKEEPSQ